jgi:hypothetical protein
MSALPPTIEAVAQIHTFLARSAALERRTQLSHVA